MTTFSDLGLRDELLQSLTELGYEEPTPIQAETIPPLNLGADLLGQAATGTGKTAAFALPLLQRITLGGRRPRALVLVPTRELATQVSEAIHKYGRHLGARVLPIYGGAPIIRQIKSLERGVDVVVATPGRTIDHLTRGTLKLQDVEVVVLDEADEMLDMGFAEDIETILDRTPPTRQTVLFSATMPPRIKRIVDKHLSDPTTISVGLRDAEPGKSPQIRQTAYVVDRAHKTAALGRILDVEQPGQALVFCRTRADVDQLTETLNGRGYRAEALHGGLSQEQRTRVLGRLRSETADLLIATDVAARGLDIDTLTHVVNFDVPSAAEAYVHRIGRVGRAGRQDDDLEPFRVVLDTLSDEFDVLNVALAAIKLAHETASVGAEDGERDIPQMSLHHETKDSAPRRPRRNGAGETARIYIGLGRAAHVRPQDLVGAITGETNLKGREIGTIEIADRFSLVEVPVDRADEVIQRLRKTTLKGRKATVRREKFERR
jgi:ATP-dependent RNA helicase DeaD